MNPQSEKLKRLLRSVQQQKITSTTCPELAVIRSTLGISAEKKKLSLQPQEAIMVVKSPEQEEHEREVEEQMEILRQINEERMKRGQIVGDPSAGPKRGAGPAPQQNMHGQPPFVRPGMRPMPYHPPGIIQPRGLMPVAQPFGINQPNANNTTEEEEYIDDENKY